ncbi:DNA polymerase kappa-like [Lytechinus variegatus]|uniref:DNA polymerase kappa-like n=1 Tax=Lytechinus variegatus TaxID=7654 RepID=UPI001BB28F45|nr:DNA polymerase kappa-like [Lytechinus variegatus]
MFMLFPGNNNVKAGGSTVSSMELNTNKAGMEGLDKERINKIIMEASKGSRYYENQKKREQQTTERINKMMEKLSQLTESEKQAALTQVDEMVRDLELSRDLNRTIVHLDMDMFFAAVEMRDNPELKEKPMAVGGMHMLSTSNYKARRFGVRAAMPGFIAKKLCPELVLVPSHFDKYQAVSTQVREILAEYDPNFCPMSLDEAYFDLTEYLERRRTMSADERTYPYWSAESSDQGGEGQKSSSDEAAHQEKPSDDGPSGDDQTCVGEDKSLFTMVSRNQGQVTSGTDATDLDKDRPQSPCHQENAEDQSRSLGSCTPEGGRPELLTQEMDDGESASGTKRNESRCETFGVTCEEVVREIRFRIEQKTRLTASAGIAPNCMLAKICSDKNKPNGQYRIPPTRDDVMDFIRDLPIRKISGIGKVTERMLSALGIQTCTDLYQQRAHCYLLFSQISSSYFLRISLGIGSTHVERDGERKSMSTERTFKEMSVPTELYSKCMELCESLAEDVKKEQIQGKTVTVKLKTVDFKVKSRASSLKTPVSSAQEIFAIARDLIRTEIRACHPEPLRLRLMGVRLSSLEDASKSSKSKQGTLLAMFAKKQSNNPQQTATPAPDCREPNMDLLEEKASINNVSGSVETTGGESDVRRISDVAPNTGMSSSDNEVLASNMGVLSPNAEAGVDATIVKKDPEENEDIVLRSKKTREIRDSAWSIGAGLNINSANSTVSSDSESKAINARSLSNGISMGEVEPRLLFCDDEYVSGRENNLPSITDGEEPTEQLYHPESLSKSEIFNEENNQRVDIMLRKNSHRKSGENGGTECSSVVKPEAQKMLTCPICRQERAYCTLEGLNQHIDACLNRSAIKEILQRERLRSSGSNNTQPTKRSPPKKIQSRKRSNSGSSSSKKKRSKSTPCRTLHDFFQKKDKTT